MGASDRDFVLVLEVEAALEAELDVESGTVEERLKCARGLCGRVIVSTASPFSFGG